jgi:hypothetical protein
MDDIMRGRALPASIAPLAMCRDYAPRIVTMTGLTNGVSAPSFG